MSILSMTVPVTIQFVKVGSAGVLACINHEALVRIRAGAGRQACPWLRYLSRFTGTGSVHSVLITPAVPGTTHAHPGSPGFFLNAACRRNLFLLCGLCRRFP